MRVNGEPVVLHTAPNRTLLEVLREDLQLTGTKHGCELGECGACAVVVDGQPVLSCLTLAVECEESDVVTVEGLSTDAHLDPLQEAFADSGAVQCGYCTPGFLITARALLDENPNPTRAEISEALSGGLCRCTGYLAIVDAVSAAALRLQPCEVGDARPQGDSTFDLRPSTFPQVLRSQASEVEHAGLQHDSTSDLRPSTFPEVLRSQASEVEHAGLRLDSTFDLRPSTLGEPDDQPPLAQLRLHASTAERELSDMRESEGRRSKVEGRITAKEQKRVIGRTE